MGSGYVNAKACHCNEARQDEDQRADHATEQYRRSSHLGIGVDCGVSVVVRRSCGVRGRVRC